MNFQYFGCLDEKQVRLAISFQFILATFMVSAPQDFNWQLGLVGGWELFFANFCGHLPTRGHLAVMIVALGAVHLSVFSNIKLDISECNIGNFFPTFLFSFSSSLFSILILLPCFIACQQSFLECVVNL